MVLFYRGQIGAEDIEFGGGTFNRKEDGSARALHKINDSYLPLTSQTDKFLSDLMDKGYDVDIYPRVNIPKSSADAVMTGHETFAPTDGHIFWRDPGGANRNFNPSGTFIAGHVIVLINTADDAEIITFDSAGLAQQVNQNERAIFCYENTLGWTLVNLYKPASTTNLEWSNTLSADHSFNGIYSEETVGEDVVFAEALYLKSDGKLWKSDADASTTMPIIALALGAISADGSGNVLRQGYIRDDSWAWTVGGLIYASLTSGELTQTRPTVSNDRIQIVGYAYSADIMYFNPNLNDRIYLQDTVQAVNAGIATNDTLDLVFDFEPSKILISYSVALEHDTSFEGGLTKGTVLATITGTDTITFNNNSNYFQDYNGTPNAGAAATNDTTNFIYAIGGRNGSTNSTLVASVTWVSSTHTLTLTFTEGHSNTGTTQIEIFAIAYKEF